MIPPFLVHWKAEVAILSIPLAIGLLVNEVTSPKVLAVMVFLSDWSMLWTWEWWTRMIVFGAISFTLLALQRRKFMKRIEAMQGDLRHAQLRIDILTRK